MSMNKTKLSKKKHKCSIENRKTKRRSNESEKITETL